MNNSLIIAYDFGTSSVKAGLVDRNGRLVSTAICSYPLLYPRPGWVEQDPEKWWQAMCVVTRKLLRQTGCDKKSVVALNICAQMCGTVPVDEKGAVLSNCLTWLDSRSASIARNIMHGYIRISGYGIIPLARWLWHTNGAPNLEGRDPVSKILWFRKNKPAIWNATCKFLDVKDYLVYRCCKMFITTPDNAHLSWLMDSTPGKLKWCDSLLEKLNLRKDLLPDIYTNNVIAGELDNQAATDLGLTTTTRVMAGAGDVTASALGAGSLSESEPHLHLGTSAWLGVHVPNRKVDVFNGIGTISSASNGQYLLVAAQQSGAKSLDWVIKSLNDYSGDENIHAAIDAEVNRAPVGCNGLRFTPWLLGECVPKHVPENRAEFFHISENHTNGDIYRSVMEGVALNIRWAFEAFARQTKGPQNLRAFGGGVISNSWCQILADCLQVPILQLEYPKFTGVYGVSKLASVALGWNTDLAEAVSTTVINNKFIPNTRHMDYYDNAFGEYLRLYQQQKNKP